MDIVKPLMQLSLKRKIFNSEADFQFALAWEIQTVYPEAKIRLEYSPSCISPAIHVDIMVIIDDFWYPIELKYKTISCTKNCDDEIFKLKNHGAQDLGRYDYLKDVQRIEKLKETLPNFKRGYAVLLTNDSAYWSNSERIDMVYNEFKLSENMIKTGKMIWASHAGKGTTKGRENPIELKDKYIVKWQKYSELDETRSGFLKYLIMSNGVD